MITMRKPFLALAATLAALLSPSALQSKTPAGPEEGKPAPSIRLNDHEGNIVSVGGESERWTVLAFYPKAMTPG